MCASSGSSNFDYILKLLFRSRLRSDRGVHPLPVNGIVEMSQAEQAEAQQHNGRAQQRADQLSGHVGCPHDRCYNI